MYFVDFFTQKRLVIDSFEKPNNFLRTPIESLHLFKNTTRILSPYPESYLESLPYFPESQEILALTFRLPWSESHGISRYPTFPFMESDTYIWNPMSYLRLWFQKNKKVVGLRSGEKMFHSGKFAVLLRELLYFPK